MQVQPASTLRLLFGSTLRAVRQDPARHARYLRFRSLRQGTLLAAGSVALAIASCRAAAVRWFGSRCSGNDAESSCEGSDAWTMVSACPAAKRKETVGARWSEDGGKDSGRSGGGRGTGRGAEGPWWSGQGLDEGCPSPRASGSVCEENGQNMAPEVDSAAPPGLSDDKSAGEVAHALPAADGPPSRKLAWSDCQDSAETGAGDVAAAFGADGMGERCPPPDPAPLANCVSAASRAHTPMSGASPVCVPAPPELSEPDSDITDGPARNGSPRGPTAEKQGAGPGETAAGPCVEGQDLDRRQLVAAYEVNARCALQVCRRSIVPLPLLSEMAVVATTPLSAQIVSLCRSCSFKAILLLLRILTSKVTALWHGPEPRL